MTNNTTIGAYRGAGRPEATQLIERVLDIAADEIGIDPAEIRRINFIQSGKFPLTTVTGGGLRLGRVREVARRCAEGRRATRSCGPSRPRRRAAGDTKQLGIGCLDLRRGHRAVGLHIEYGAVEIDDDGSATCSPAPARTAKATTRRSPCSPAKCSASRWTRSR